MTTRNNPPVRFNYRFSNASCLSMILATVAVTLLSAYIAYTMPDGRLIRILTGAFSRESVSVMFWGTTLFCVVATIYATTGAINARKISYVELGPGEAYVPSASVSMTPITIPYNSIRKIEVYKIKQQQMAVISSTAGEARLIDRYFDQPGDFRSFLQALEQRRQS